MKSIPRILPLVGVAMGGVLVVNAMAGAEGLPGLVSGARAFAEESAKGGKAKPEAKAATAQGKNAAATVPAAAKPAAICAPTAADLAKEAGLSPAELQVLQSLGVRRSELDAREGDLETQLALLAAAQAKLDAKFKALNALKGDIQGLLVQADTKEAAEIDRLVKVYEGMKAKDAAPRLTVLDDDVRLPIAAKMKERSLSAIMAQMPPSEAKKMSEGLAKRFQQAKQLAANAQAAANQAAANTPAPGAANAPAAPKAQAAAPKKAAPKPQAKAAPRKAAPPAAQAAAAPPAAAAPAAGAPAATPPAKAG